MADISNKEIAAILASGIMAASAGRLSGANPDKQASIAIEVYRECLKQIPGKEPTNVVSLSRSDT
jgi:hypothetical protein